MSAPIREAARLLWRLRHDGKLAELEHVLASLPTEDLALVSACWQLWAREKQLRPAACKPIWAIVAGRGFGKTRSAVEDTLDLCEDWGPGMLGALISKTIGDVRDDMIYGVSGLVVCGQRRDMRVDYIANKSRVFVHGSHGVATLRVMSADQADFGRGPGLNFFWGDEFSSWPGEALAKFRDGFLPSWRMPTPAGADPIATITTTPKPNALTQWLLKSKQGQSLSTVVGGSSYENEANIRLNHTALALQGRRERLQEVEGILLDRACLVTIEDIDKHRLSMLPDPDSIDEVVVAIDPAIRAKDDSDECGIVVAARDVQSPPHAYVIDDLSQQGASTQEWARAAVEAALRYGATKIVMETNQGGDMGPDIVRTAIDAIGDRAAHLEIVDVWTQRSKRARAEPIAPLYERGRVHHVGAYEQLETEWSTWSEGSPSPNRLDACVYALTHLLLEGASVAPLWTKY